MRRWWDFWGLLVVGLTAAPAAAVGSFPRLRSASLPDPVASSFGRSYRTCYFDQKVRGVERVRLRLGGSSEETPRENCLYILCPLVHLKKKKSL